MAVLLGRSGSADGPVRPDSPAARQPSIVRRVARPQIRRGGALARRVAPEGAARRLLHAAHDGAGHRHGRALYRSYAAWGLAGTIPGLVLAHTVAALPFVVINVSAVLNRMDWRLEQAARSLGAGAIQAFRRITLPIVRPGRDRSARRNCFLRLQT